MSKALTFGKLKRAKTNNPSYQTTDETAPSSEGRLFDPNFLNNNLGCKVVSLPAGGQITEHYHPDPICHFVLVLEGNAHLLYEGAEEYTLNLDDWCIIPPKAWHKLTAGKKGMKILAVSTPAYDTKDGTSTIYRTQ